MKDTFNPTIIERIIVDQSNKLTTKEKEVKKDNLVNQIKSDLDPDSISEKTKTNLQKNLRKNVKFIPIESLINNNKDETYLDNENTDVIIILIFIKKVNSSLNGAVVESEENLTNFPYSKSQIINNTSNLENQKQNEKENNDNLQNPINNEENNPSQPVVPNVNIQNFVNGPVQTDNLPNQFIY